MRIMLRNTPFTDRTLTEEEQRMWRYATRNDVQLAGRSTTIVSPPACGGIKGGDGTIRQMLSMLHHHPHLTSPASGGGIIQGAYANIDRNTAERFRKGKYPLDATLDLHGMNRERAHIALAGFIHAQYEQGSRCLLVITGKGKTGEEGRGILRELLPRWLEEFAPLLLAFDGAQPRHGGAGAFYLLLRRKR